MIALLSTAGVLLLGLLLLRERRLAAARAELVARACHEVRGPLGAAHLALHALTRRGVPTRAVEDELWRAARAVADLAAAPAGERALDTPEAVDLVALLRRQTESWRWCRAGARLRADPPGAHRSALRPRRPAAPGAGDREPRRQRARARRWPRSRSA